MRRRELPPVLVEHIQKSRAAIFASGIAHAPVGVQAQGFHGKREQDVPARVRTLHRAFQQAGIALRMRRSERQQIVRAGDFPAYRRLRNAGASRRFCPSPGARVPSTAHQRRRNTNVPLVPPKPNELDSTTSSFASRATFGTKSRSQPSPGFSRLMVGGTMESRIARIEKIASTPPAAPSRCPVMDLVELTINLFAYSPNTLLMPCTSATSPACVEVPCALMYCTSSKFKPASFIAARMQRAPPSPFSLGAVM